tara:strand:+ start:5107 stop:5340 length:234 start_codon:yes stop_codon:yes gene_type:complete
MAKVTVYSTESCPWCAKVKEFLKANKVKFSDKNVGEDKAAASEMLKKSGQMGVPVVDVDGEIIVGFNEAAIRKALKI